jgi:hypothetical protein
MKISTMTSAVFALSLLAGAGLVNSVSAQTFTASDSAYVTKGNFDDVNGGTNLNLVNQGSGNSNDYDLFKFGTTAITGNVTSLTITLFNDTSAKYGGTAATAGPLDFYFATPIGNFTSLATANTDVFSTATSPVYGASYSSVPAETQRAVGDTTTTLGTGLGLTSNLDATGFFAVGQADLTTTEEAGKSESFTFDVANGSALQTYLSGVGTNGLELIATDDSSTAGHGAQNSFYGAGSGSNDASISVMTAAPAPEASTLISMGIALALGGGLALYGKKRELS